MIMKYILCLTSVQLDSSQRVPSYQERFHNQMDLILFKEEKEIYCKVNMVKEIHT